MILKLLGRIVRYPTMLVWLKSIWKLHQGFDIKDVGHGYYMVKFDSSEDRWEVMSRGPWMIFNHYLIVKTWSPDFIVEPNTIDTTLAWVWFPSLNMVYYNESFLLRVASTLGKLIKVDLTTLNVECDRFARVCIEVYLSKPMIGRFCIKVHWYYVEYESLHLLCGGCNH